MSAYYMIMPQNLSLFCNVNILHNYAKGYLFVLLIPLYSELSEYNMIMPENFSLLCYVRILNIEDLT